MRKINKEKLEKALNDLEMKAKFVNMDYYYPRYIKLLKLSMEVM